MMLFQIQGERQYRQSNASKTNVKTEDYRCDMDEGELQSRRRECGCGRGFVRNGNVCTGIKEVGVRASSCCLTRLPSLDFGEWNLTAYTPGTSAESGSAAVSRTTLICSRHLLNPLFTNRMVDNLPNTPSPYFI